MKNMLFFIAGWVVAMLIAGMVNDLKVIGISLAFLAGIVCCFFGMLLYSFLNQPKKENDDWWKNGEKPPWETN